MVRKGKSGPLHLRQIKYFVETGKYLPSVLLVERNGIRKASKSFVMDGEFYYIGPEGTEKRLVLLTNEDKAGAFEECHIAKKSEHHGRTKTLERLKEKYYWTSMVEDTVAMMVQCKFCKFKKLSKVNRYSRVTNPWEVVTIDILGQFTVSSNGFAFVAVIIDILTKYTVAIPLRDTTVSDIAAALENSIFQLGTPRKFLSDQSENFVRELNQVLEVDKNLPKNVLSVSKTQVNRPDEAAIKLPILNHCLNSGSAWADSLNQNVYEINATYVTSSGYTPFYLMFHRSPKLSDYQSLETTTGKPTFVVRDIERYLFERGRKAKELFKEVITDQSQEITSKFPSDEKIKEESMKSTSAPEPSEFKSGDHGYQRPEHEVPSDHSMVKSEDDFTHMVQVTSESIIPDSSGSVYEMADGEGQVVIVANGICGPDDGTEVAGQHMVIVQPSLGDQGLIMLSEN